jgi:hypothetical protein
MKSEVIAASATKIDGGKETLFWPGFVFVPNKHTECVDAASQVVQQLGQFSWEISRLQHQEEWKKTFRGSVLPAAAAAATAAGGRIQSSAKISSNPTV